MSVEKQYEDPAPPPRLTQASIYREYSDSKRSMALVQRAGSEHDPAVYMSVESTFYSADDAREFAKAILEILGDEAGK